MRKSIPLSIVGAALAASVSVSIQAQPVRPETATVIERGPIHRTLEYYSWETNALGQVVSNRHRVKEVAGGMHYWADGAWRESRPVTVPHPDGAAALEGATKAVFGPDLIEAQAVVFTGAGGQRLESRLVGVAYLDRQSGEMALVGRPKSCEGFIVGNSTVAYFDALEGPIMTKLRWIAWFRGLFEIAG